MRTVIAGVIVFLLAACGGGDGEQHTIEGTMTISGARGVIEMGRDAGDGDACEGRAGYAYGDLGAGAQVTVRNGSGVTLALGRLGMGKLSGVIGTSITPAGAGTCTMPFEIEVPGSDFYEIEVSHRGGLQYSEAEMEQMDWTVSLSLES